MAVLRLGDMVSVPLARKTTSTVVTVGDICWIESLRNYTRIALKSPVGMLLFRRRLSYWDQVLPAGAFARVGLSYIVQLAAVDQIRVVVADRDGGHVWCGREAARPRPAPGYAAAGDPRRSRLAARGNEKRVTAVGSNARVRRVGWTD